MGEVVKTEREWLSSLDSHSRVIAAYSMRTRQDVADDRELERRRQEARQLQQDYSDLVLVGLASSRSHYEILRGFAVAADDQDRRDAARDQADRTGSRQGFEGPVGL